MRAAENSVFELFEERLLSQEALDGGVVRDALVKLDGLETAADRVVRRVEVQVKPHPRSGNKPTDLIILYTNLLDLPAELIALIYLYRYTVELFFRIFKQLLGMRHLLSQRQEGIDIQIHCADRLRADSADQRQEAEQGDAEHDRLVSAGAGRGTGRASIPEQAG